jgi:hypothetical protein
VLLADAVPVVDALLAIVDVVGAQHLVHRVAQRDLLLDQLAFDEALDLERALERLVLLVVLLLEGAALEAGGEEVGRVRGDLGAVEVGRGGDSEVDVLLHQLERDRAVVRGVLARVFLHDLAGALDHAADDPLFAQLGAAQPRVIRLDTYPPALRMQLLRACRGIRECSWTGKPSRSTSSRVP